MSNDTRQRGDGSLYRRGRIWHMQYYRSGHPIRESAYTADEQKARKLLRQRIEEKKKPHFVGPSENKLTLEDLEAAIKADYVRQGRRSWDTVQDCLNAVKKYFPKYTTLVELGERIREYQDARITQGKACATVNRECAYLRHGFRLLFEDGKISRVPVIKMLEGEAENAREGFIEPADFNAALDKIRDPDTRDIVEFLYASGRRGNEAKRLEWSQFDENSWQFRFSRKKTKNKKPLTLVLVGRMREIIERRLRARRPDCTLVFHRNGRQIKSFRKAFQSACGEVGLHGLVPHDMRRSAVRNLRRAGNDEHDCMKITGHLTRAIFDRYDIIDEEDQRRTLEKTEVYVTQQVARGRKVVPMTRKAG